MGASATIAGPDCRWTECADVYKKRFAKRKRLHCRSLREPGLLWVEICCCVGGGVGVSSARCREGMRRPAPDGEAPGAAGADRSIAPIGATGNGVHVQHDVSDSYDLTIADIHSDRAVALSSR